MPTWPTTLPQCPILNDYTETRQRNIASFKPEVGLPKQRRRSTAAYNTVTLSYRMTSAQKEIFFGFYIDDCADGSLSFSWAHPISKVVETWIFSDEPKVERFAPSRWRVSFTLFRTFIG